jgi:hypothetical protein
MQSTYAVILTAMAIALLFGMYRQAASCRTLVVSYKNLFLLGLLQFQLVSGAATLFFDIYDGLFVESIAVTGLLFLLILASFWFFFAWMYPRQGLIDRLAARNANGREFGSGGVIAMCYISLVAGTLVRLLGGPMPVVGPLLIQLSSGMLMLTGACTGWCIASGSNRILYGALGFAAMSASFVLLLIDSFGRRDLVGLMLAFVWGAFYGGWWQIPLRTFAARAAVLLSCAIAVLLLFSAARTVKGRDPSLQGLYEVTLSLDSNRLWLAGADAISGQCAAANSMWTIEHYPSEFPFRPIHTVWYLLTMAVPRQFWDDKPSALAEVMVYQGGITRVARGYNLGPGLVAHLYTELWFVTVPLYAVLLSGWIRYIDVRSSAFRNCPSIVLPLGVGLGQALAMARGELGLFVFQTITAIGGALLVASISRYSFGVRED